MGAEPMTYPSNTDGRKFGWGKMILIILAVAVVTCALTFWFLTAYLFPKRLKPVALSAKEEKVLEQKLTILDPFSDSNQSESGKPLAEKYSEAGADRTITFTQRELNGLLAKNTDLADKLAVHLSDDMASAKFIVPLDPDFPILGGKTLKVSAGLTLNFSDGKPVVALRGISLWGVPIPNAWLGGIKNVDLVKEFGGGDGFWRKFSEGVEHIRLKNGELTIILKE